MSLPVLASLALLPPANAVLLCCAGAAAMRWRVGRIAVRVGAAAMLAMSTPLAAGWMSWGLEEPFGTANMPGPPPQAIVVLAGDQATFDEQGSAADDGGRLTLVRERAAARLARETGLPVLASGGRLRPGSPPIAELMAAGMLRDFGMGVRWVEGGSFDTWDNARLSAAMLRASGITSAYVVTTSWHERRALAAFRYAGFRVVAAPAEHPGQPSFGLSAVTPWAPSLTEAYYAAHEWAGLLGYRARAVAGGWAGRWSGRP